MIEVNGKEYTYSLFPNGEIKFFEVLGPASLADAAKLYSTGHTIKWVFESNEEFFVLQMIVKHLKEIGGGYPVSLFMPYCPYGQQDRRMDGQLFSFKYFAQLLNDLQLDRVHFLDPHSGVMDAAISHSKVSYIHLDETMRGYDLLFYPDNGAAKKYSEVYPGRPYRFGNKKRNLDTGDILKYEVIADKTDIENKKVLIVDDLCMGGRTFQSAAQALKELGAKKIGLQITHLMPESVTFVQEFQKYDINELYTYVDGISGHVVKGLWGNDYMAHGVINTDTLK